MDKVKPLEGDIITLPEERIDPTRTNIVRARKIVVSGAVVLHGQSLALYAHEIEFQAGGKIDTSGGAPDKDFTNSPALSGRVSGEAGKNGEDATRGKDGGAIRIWAERFLGTPVIRTAGGPGGRGQDGGSGQTGRKGQNASQQLFIPRARETGPRNNPGGPGQSGGNGGNPGKSGAGGNGGAVEIAVVDNASVLRVRALESQIRAAAIGGAGGAPASAGAGGGGGEGGNGGPYGHVECRHRPGPEGGDTDCRNRQDGIGPNGTPGKIGSTGTAGAAGVVGANGAVAIRSLTLQEFAQSSTSSHLAALLSKGEAEYRNGAFPRAAEILTYVYRLANERRGS